MILLEEIMRLSITFKTRDFSNFYIEKELLATNSIFIKLIAEAPLLIRVYVYTEALDPVNIIRSIR